MLVPEEFQDRSVCVMGLGYVGLTLAVVMADVGFDVLGVEIRPETVKSLRNGVSHFYEPGLEQKLAIISKNGAYKLKQKSLKTLNPVFISLRWEHHFQIKVKPA